LYAAHVEEPKKTKGPSLEYFIVLQVFEYVFQEIPRLPPKNEIDFSIDLVPSPAPISKTPYILSTPKLKEITNAIGRIVEERVHTPKCFTSGRTHTLYQKKGWDLEALY